MRLFLLLLLTACQSLPQTSDQSFVYAVIDGDTILTSVGKVRLLGIDAPEMGECGADEATERLADLVEGKNVTLVFDRLQSDRDKYGRLLRYVHLGSDDIGAILLTEGKVRVFPWLPSDRLELYEKIATPIPGCNDSF